MSHCSRVESRAWRTYAAAAITDMAAATTHDEMVRRDAERTEADDE